MHFLIMLEFEVTKYVSPSSNKNPSLLINFDQSFALCKGKESKEINENLTLQEKIMNIHRAF